MNISKSIAALVIISTVPVSLAIAGGSATHFSQAANHSTKTAWHSAAMSGKAVAGSVALPLAVVGTVGKISGQASNDLWGIANKPARAPLPIAKETFTATQSPKDALFDKGKSR